MKFYSSSSMLVREMAKKSLLTVKLEPQLMIEFQAASKILGSRTVSAIIHQFAMQKVREAKNLVSDEEFNEVVSEQEKETAERSKRKALERQKINNKIDSLSETMPATDEKYEGELDDENKIKNKRAKKAK